MLNEQDEDIYKEKYQNAFPLPVVLLLSLVAPTLPSPFLYKVPRSTQHVPPKQHAT